ncbi:DUF7534 family protein [Halocatena pleomorpha]|uniref:Uncharacterized protein n=1 Tax=Halocatena pleomorpha TaxID=1785090 RepID=A0A3P3R632_9EURY|nr:hypothetical protein [Halocatena pleomorpha]RRJ28023.1 hypothetical protein EIK79_16700 [Halocatena pleomorpha]
MARIRPCLVSQIGGCIGPLGLLAQLFALVLGAKLSPPDPFTQLLQLSLLVVVGLLPVYWLVWGGSCARLRRRVGLVHEDEQRH